MFHVGQKVVCVDAKRTNRVWRGEITPIEGTVYTIRDSFINETNGHPVVRLEEIVNPILPYADFKDEMVFGARRFRPVQTTNISIFQAMLVPTPKEKVEA